MAFGNPFVRIALAAALAASTLRTSVIDNFNRTREVRPCKKREKGYGTTNWKKKLGGRTNGARECARRVRQIAGGQHGAR